MASETATGAAAEAESRRINWPAGLAGGLVGTAAFGVMLTVMMPDVIEVAIPSLYGLAPPPDLVTGWVVHLVHGAVLGLVFAGLVGLVGLGRDSPSGVVAAGVGYGLVVWLVLASFVMPLWLSAVGSPADPPLPNFSVPSLVGHAVFGLLLGAVYAAMD